MKQRGTKGLGRQSHVVPSGWGDLLALAVISEHFFKFRRTCKTWICMGTESASVEDLFGHGLCSYSLWYAALCHAFPVLKMIN